MGTAFAVAWIVVRRAQGRLAEPTVEQPSKQPLSCVLGDTLLGDNALLGESW